MRGTSIYNILSSNIINLIQYLATIILNKNGYRLKNNAIKTDIILVVFTIIIPILLLIFDIEVNITIVPLFIILFFFFRYLDHNAHKLYLNKEDKIIEAEKEEEIKKEKSINSKKATKYILILIVSGILLFIVGELLGNTLENLSNIFNVPQVVIGILLGIITSIPELITFFESQKHHKKTENEILGVVEATNNLLTSNILNLFIIQAIGVLIINII